MENCLHQIYNLLNAQVTVVNWYWSRRDMIKDHYIVEVDDLR